MSKGRHNKVKGGVCGPANDTKNRRKVASSDRSVSDDDDVSLYFSNKSSDQGLIQRRRTKRNLQKNIRGQVTAPNDSSNKFACADSSVTNRFNEEAPSNRVKRSRKDTVTKTSVTVNHTSVADTTSPNLIKGCSVMDPPIQFSEGNSFCSRKLRNVKNRSVGQKVKSKKSATIKMTDMDDSISGVSLVLNSDIPNENQCSSAALTLPDLVSREQADTDVLQHQSPCSNHASVGIFHPESHLLPERHDRSKNIFHYISNSAIGRSSPENKQAVVDTCILSRLADFEITCGSHPFSSRVTTIDWHPRQDDIIVTGSKHGDLAFYRVGNESLSIQEVKSFNGIGPGGYISAFKFHPVDNEKFYTASLDSKVCLGNMEKDQHYRESVLFDTDFLNRWFCSLDVHRTENLVAAGLNTGWTLLMSRTGEKIWEKRLHTSKISHLEFSPREPFLLCSASLDHSVRMWDIRMIVEKKPLACLHHEKGLNSAYFSLTDGTRLLTTDQFDEIRVYRAPFWHMETCIKHPHRFFQHLTPIKAYWHPLSDNIICGRFPDDKNYPELGSRRTMDVFDASNGKMCLELKDSHYTGIVSLCKFNKMGTTLLSSMGYNFNIWSQKMDEDDMMSSEGEKSSVEITDLKHKTSKDYKYPQNLLAPSKRQRSNSEARLKNVDDRRANRQAGRDIFRKKRMNIDKGK